MRIARLNGQPILSMADVQMGAALGRQPKGAKWRLIWCGAVKRNACAQAASDWRAADDISWRASTWGLRRMALGGLTLEPLPEEERKIADVDAGDMALRVKNVGQYGLHAPPAMRAFKRGRDFGGRRPKGFAYRGRCPAVRRAGAEGGRRSGRH